MTVVRWPPMPWPPSVNRYYRTVNGRMLISAEGRKYRKQVAEWCLVNRFNRWGGLRLEIKILACPPDRRRRDLDNLLKAMLDAMEHAGIYENDSQIDDLRITRGPVEKGGAMYVNIQAIERSES